VSVSSRSRVLSVWLNDPPGGLSHLQPGFTGEIE
jgi:hypothetical protein